MCVKVGLIYHGCGCFWCHHHTVPDTTFLDVISIFTRPHAPFLAPPDRWSFSPLLNWTRKSVSWLTELVFAKLFDYLVCALCFFFHFFMYFSLVLVLVFAFGLKVLTLSVPLVSNCPYFVRLQCKHLFAGMKRHLIFIAPRLVGVLPFYIICFSLKNMKYKFPCDSLWHVPLAQQTKRK